MSNLIDLYKDDTLPVSKVIEGMTLIVLESDFDHVLKGSKVIVVKIDKVCDSAYFCYNYENCCGIDIRVHVLDNDIVKRNIGACHFKLCTEDGKVIVADRVYAPRVKRER